MTEAASPAPGAGDIGRRVANARKRQRLTRTEAAGRAAMSPEYLTYVEERPADPSLGALMSLAAALDTTVGELRGEDIDRPPGQGQANLFPRLRELSDEECLQLLSSHGVGRVSVSTAEGPAVIPVNYAVVDGAVVFRTAPHAAPAAAVGTEVAFEVDHVDEALSEGWSVLVVGPAHAVTDPHAVERLTERAHSKPWAGGERELWVSIRPSRLTGRRIHGT